MLSLFPTLLLPDHLSLTNSPPQCQGRLDYKVGSYLNKDKNQKERLERDKVTEPRSSTGLHLCPEDPSDKGAEHTNDNETAQSLCHWSSFICQSLWSLVDKCTSSLIRWLGYCSSSLRDPDRCARQMKRVVKRITESVTEQKPFLLAPAGWSGLRREDRTGKQDYLYFLTIFLLTLRKAGEWRVWGHGPLQTSPSMNSNHFFLGGDKILTSKN